MCFCFLFFFIILVAFEVKEVLSANDTKNWEQKGFFSFALSFCSPLLYSFLFLFFLPEIMFHWVRIGVMGIDRSSMHPQDSGRRFVFLYSFLLIFQFFQFFFKYVGCSPKDILSALPEKTAFLSLQTLTFTLFPPRSLPLLSPFLHFELTRSLPQKRPKKCLDR